MATRDASAMETHASASEKGRFTTATVDAVDYVIYYGDKGRYIGHVADEVERAFYHSDKGRFVTLTGSVHQLRAQVTMQVFYKVQRSCTTDPSGYDEWVNETGDSTGAPVCGGTHGHNEIVSRWHAQQ